MFGSSNPYAHLDPLEVKAGCPCKFYALLDRVIEKVS